jgi:hypothetical protein
MARVKRMASCHPQQPYHAKDLCKECYCKRGNQIRMLNPEFRKKGCIRSRKWALDNPERAYRLDANKHLKKKYGISLEDYESLHKAQDGLCCICKKPESITTKKRISRLAVDHCHVTGKIRGLLCFKCNTSIALIEEDPNRLKAIRDYLEIKNVI